MSLRWSFVAGSAVTNSVYWKCRLRKVQWNVNLSKDPQLLVRKSFSKGRFLGDFWEGNLFHKLCLVSFKVVRGGGKIATNRRPSGDCQGAFWRRRIVTCSGNPSLGFCRGFSTGKKASDSVQDVAMASSGSGFCRFVWWDVQGRTMLSPWEEKLFTPPQKKPSLWEESPTTWRCSSRNPLHSLQLRIQPRKFTEKFNLTS